ncbi:MAG: TIGR03790 family protein [Limisphaerales bacterium]
MKFWLFLFSIFLALSSFAANDGNDVVVVFNSAMPESKDVADHYAQMRSVPAAQVIGFALPQIETMSRDEYRDELQNPLLKYLEKQNLFTFKSAKLTEAKVRYIVLCYGVPIRIDADSSISEKIPAEFKGELRKNGAAVDSELAWLPNAFAKLPLAGPLSNPLFRATNSAVMNPTNGIIIVTRLDGPTPQIARALVDKAITAERDGLWGRAYFDMRSITNATFADADTNFLIAAQCSQQMGFETVIDKKPETFPKTFPMSQIALYGGWYDENVSGPFTRPNVEFMPGAFAYHLHSYSAQTLRSTNTHWAGPLLAAGATATMGAVDEPFIEGLPDMGVFFTRWLLLHTTYGEAAYSSLKTVSWQDIVIGDPLYNPFRKPAQQLHEELAKRGSKLIEWSHLKVVDLNLALGTPVRELVQYLNQEPTTKTSAVLSEKLGDFYSDQGKPESAMFQYRQALNLNPSPQQEVRLRLGLIHKLLDAGKHEEAVAEFQEFRKHCRDYPDMDALEQQVLTKQNPAR